MASETNSSAEAAFVHNLRSARTAKGMTQAELAEAMAQRGFRWHPPTVYKVESGERQIQLGEALELSKILGVPLEDMSTPGNPSAQHRAAIDDSMLRAASAQVKVVEAIADYLPLVRQLKVLVDETPDLERLCSDEELALLRWFADSPFNDALEAARTNMQPPGFGGRPF